MVEQHVARIAVNAHHLADQVERYCRTRPGTPITLSVESEILGTAGAVGRLRDWIDGADLLVVNGDRWCPDPLGELIDGWDRDRLRMLVVLDEDRADFEGRWRYAGACLIPGRIAAALPDEFAGLYATVFGPMLEAGRVELVPTAAPFFDCGTPADYHAANMTASGGANVVGAGAVVLGEIERTVVWDEARVGPDEHLVDAIRADGGVTVVVQRRDP